ncbi:MAG: BatD family protein [Bacteroidota bacterium]|nr:BatD family protein [Bacteroidota bacterium]
MKKAFYILSILLFSLTTFADDVQFKASTKSPVRVGERFRLIFSVNGDGERFQPPQINDFIVLSGPSTSSSSSIQIINGKITRNEEKTYSYILQAKKEGGFTIAPAKIRVDGKEYSSNSLTIKVVAGNKNAVQSSTNSSNNYNNGQNSGESEKTPYAFLKTKISNKKPFIGEQVIVSYDLYYRVNITNYEFHQLPSYPGCWSQKISEGNNSQHVETINGVQYQVAEIFKEAVFPQKSGKLKAKPMEFLISARIRSKNQRSRDPFNSFFDNAFMSNSQSIKKTLKSDPITFNVKAIPIKGQPIDFSGAVGSFSLNATVDKTQLKANEAINLTIKIEGKGNISLVESPVINFPPDFETYDPEVNKKINKSPNAGISGSKTFKYLIIPRVEGEYSIDPIHFTYYDLVKKRYISLSSKKFTFNIAPGKNNATQAITYSSSQEEIKYLGNDIRFIITTPLELQKKGYLFLGSIAFWMWILIPIILLFFIFLFRMIVLKRSSNIVLQKERKATRIAKKRLTTAEKLKKSDNAEAFYNEIAQAVWGYISDKFNLPLSDLSMDSAREKLNNKNIGENLTNQFINTLEECEYARFAPGDKSQVMEDLYNKAQDVIIKTEKELK